MTILSQIKLDGGLLKCEKRLLKQVNVVAFFPSQHGTHDGDGNRMRSLRQELVISGVQQDIGQFALHQREVAR